MGLDIVSLPDSVGAAVYLISNGQHAMDNALTQLGNEIKTLTTKDTQIVLLDMHHGDGIKVKEFYGLTSAPTIMIILDDDTVPYIWTNTLPRASEVAYHLNQIEGR
jgi:hypothetical protein